MSVSTTVAIIQVPYGCTIPTSGGITGVEYSNVYMPEEFVTAERRWEILAYFQTAYQTSATSGTYYNPSSAQLKVPKGDYSMIGYRAYRSRAAITATASSFVQSRASLSETPASVGTDEEVMKWSAMNAIDFYATGSLAITTNGSFNMFAPKKLDAATIYYANWSYSGGGTFLNSSCGFQNLLIYAVPAGI